MGSGHSLSLGPPDPYGLFRPVFISSHRFLLEKQVLFSICQRQILENNHLYLQIGLFRTGESLGFRTLLSTGLQLLCSKVSCQPEFVNPVSSLGEEGGC